MKFDYMRDSNTFMYVVGGIILLHFVVGFVWLLFKFSKKKEEKKTSFLFF
jgi:flagellar biogenesis protein FliO